MRGKTGKSWVASRCVQADVSSRNAFASRKASRNKQENINSQIVKSKQVHRHPQTLKYASNHYKAGRQENTEGGTLRESDIQIRS
jgi:hypothetical protein